MVDYVSFPAACNANEDGLLAMGGDLSMDTLVSAYSQGIFPWFNEGQPVLWWSPDPRLVLFPEQVRISRSLAKIIRQQRFTLSCDQQFEKVVRGCAMRGNPQPFSAKAETWITASMAGAYLNLFENDYAHSIEVWQEQQLVGGLYGVALGDVFFGESMFSNESDASKVALVGLCQFLASKKFRVIDCQVETDHLVSMGARSISREAFLEYLQDIDIEQATTRFADGFAQPDA